MKTESDPNPGDRKVTNADEQEVAVNRSTASGEGYDEPVHHEAEAVPTNSQETQGATAREKKSSLNKENQSTKE